MTAHSHLAETRSCSSVNIQLQMKLVTLRIYIYLGTENFIFVASCNPSVSFFLQFIARQVDTDDSIVLKLVVKVQAAVRRLFRNCCVRSSDNNKTCHGCIVTISNVWIVPGKLGARTLDFGQYFIVIYRYELQHPDTTSCETGGGVGQNLEWDWI